jgi:hypothetical protein
VAAFVGQAGRVEGAEVDKELLERALTSPDSLGGIERNAEFKVVAPTLRLLDS